MAMQEKYRTRLDAHFVETIDEETADAVLAEFPARDLDRPATRDFVAVTAAELRTEIESVRTALTGTEHSLRTEIESVRTALTRTEHSLRAEMHEGFGALRLELQQQTDKVLKRLQLLGGLAVIVTTVATSIVTAVS